MLTFYTLYSRKPATRRKRKKQKSKLKCWNMFRKEQRNWELFLLHCNACILCFIFIPNDMIDDKSLIFPYFMLIHGATICTVLCFARVYVKLFEKSIYFLLQIESNNRKRSHNQQYFSICNASNSGREYRNLYRDQHI